VARAPDAARPRVPVSLARARFPPAVLRVLTALDRAGHPSWIVGGAVRDLLLRRPAPDFDLATPATPQEVTDLFRRVVPTGVDHGTVTVLEGDEKIEVTTFRGEGAYLDGRRPGSVTFHRDLDADLARRDFTMNALAFDPLRGEFRDPFGGRADLRRRLIRAVGDPAERFAEDGLRAMRAVRFAAQLGYGLDRRTRAAIPGTLDVVARVSPERIADELGKLLLARSAARGLELMRATGLLAVVLPEVDRLPGRALRHALRLVARVRPDPVLRWAALLHGRSPEQAEGILVRLRLPRRLAEDVRALLRGHGCALGRAAPLPAGPVEVRRWLAAVGPGRAPALLELASAEAGELPPSRARRRAAAVRRLRADVERVRASGAALTAQGLALDGRGVMEVLGTGPGPQVGEALRHLLDQVLADPGLNERDRLADALRRWWEARL